MKVISFLKNYTKEAIMAPLFKFVEAGFELAVPIVIKKILDDGVSNDNLDICIVNSILLILFAVLGLAFSITAQYFSAKAAVGVAADLRSELYKKIQGFSYSSIDNFGTSSLITNMTSDIMSVQSGVNMFLRLFLRSPFIVIGAVVMAFVVNPKLALIFAIAVPILSIFVFFIVFVSVPLFKKVQKKLEIVLKKSTESIDGVRVIRAFCLENEETEQFKKTNNEHRLLQIIAGRLSALLNPLTITIINLAIVAILYFGGIDVKSNIVSIGIIVALYNYMSQILVELIKLANLIVTLNKSLASASRIDDILESEEYSKSLPSPEQYPGVICMKNVSANYTKKGNNALTNINITLNYGETLGVIGRTGCGKTTFINLIPHFYDTSEGSVAVKGKDVLLWNEKELRSIIGIVPQRAVLFSGTIRENLQMGIFISDEELIKALKMADAYDFLLEKGGLDAKVEKSGKNFSGGQKQRITIARALARKPEILIMDDSFSALDFKTDAKIREEIDSLDFNPTTIIVSQRTSSIMNADKILVLSNGNAVGIGKHDELLEKCEEYRDIYYSQFGKEAE